jgi:hypothetical protein
MLENPLPLPSRSNRKNKKLLRSGSRWIESLTTNVAVPVTATSLLLRSKRNRLKIKSTSMFHCLTTRVIAMSLKIRLHLSTEVSDWGVRVCDRRCTI